MTEMTEPRSIEDRNARIAEIDSEIAQIDSEHNGRKFPDDVRARWNRLNAEREEHMTAVGELRTRRQRLETLSRNQNATERPSTPASLPNSGTPSYDAARRAIDASHRSGLLPDGAADKATRLVTAGPTHERGLAARWAAAAGAQEYASAFAKLAADPTRGHLLWTNEESAAYRNAATVQAEMRAMGVGSLGAGGYMLPLVLDPAIMLTNDGSTNPLRQISRVVQTVSNSWHGITSAGATAEWKAEHAEVADASPTIAQPEIPVYLGDAYVPYSFEVGQDAMNFLSELQRVLADAADQLQATAYMRGTGSGQPTGVVTALPSGSKVATATADTLVAADVVGLQNALPPRFQANAQWCSNLAVANEVAGFETTNGSLRFPEMSGNPPRLLRKPWNEASHLDTPGGTASAGNDNVLLYGDFSQFVIVDRIGTTLEFVPIVVGANQRPTGERGALLWFRSGSDVVVDSAFRLLTS